MKRLPVSMEVLSDFHNLIESIKKAHDAAETHFTPLETNLLLFLDEPRRMGALAEQLFCQPSNMTAVVDKLERDKLIKRERSMEDRRAVALVLTAKGKKTREQIIDRTAGFIEELSHLSAEDFEDIKVILGRNRPA